MQLKVSCGIQMSTMALRDVNLAEIDQVVSYQELEQLDSNNFIDQVFELAINSLDLRQHIQLSCNTFKWNVLKVPEYKRLLMTGLKPVQ